MRFSLWFLTLLLSTMSYAKDDDMKVQTFDTVKTPTAYSTGLNLSKGWGAKVTYKDVKAQAALPRHFDWREQGKLTPSKNQGNCGSCWSMATTSVLQDVMALRGMGQIALSEQYLLSCNKEGWSCNGGFFAHNYHMALPMGAVPEAEFPYVAQQVPCKANLSHPYHITSWAYLPSPNEDTPPSIDSIKAAIYTYGPIAAAVGANDAFMSYSSGVFNRCDNTQPNHAITLVGWDDDGQYFILKNSWGGSWGLNGYMNIKYNCNKIGIAANYIVFNSQAPTPGPTPPPIPKCTPEPYADAGKDVRVGRGQSVRLGTPAREQTAYHWESSARLRLPETAQIVVRPVFSQIFTVFATTKCGTAKSSIKVFVGR